MNMKKIDVLCIGELLIDMFPEKIGPRIGEVKAFMPKPGGAPANVAVAAKRLGATSAFIGKVGDDLFGIYLKKVLDDEGVITSGLRFDKNARTTLAIIAMPDENSAEFVFYRNPGADQLLSVNDLDLGLIDATKSYHFGSVSLTDEPARSATVEGARRARKAGALVSYDVNYRPSLWKDSSQALEQAREMLIEVDLVKVNEEEAALLTGRDRVDPADLDQVENAAIQLLDNGPNLVVVTLGSEGSYFQTSSGGGYVPPFRVETIDAVGCGDAFVAGLLTKLIGFENWSEELSVENMYGCLRFANAVGALTSLKRGAIPAMPVIGEVIQFLEQKE